MSKKDPAFLLYSNDWLQGTAHMLPEEKGVYIDLLCHQHQNGFLPSDIKRLARLAGLSEDLFLPIWQSIKSKFQEADGGVLVNQKLYQVVNQRATYGLTKKISGTFAWLIRTSKEPPEIKQKVKQMFKNELFFDQTDQTLTEAMTKWFTFAVALGHTDGIYSGTPNTVIVNTNTNTGLVNKESTDTEDSSLGRVRETLYDNPDISDMAALAPGAVMLAAKSSPLVPQMVQIFKKHFPSYPDDPENDYPACLKISGKISKPFGWTQEQILNGKMTDLLAEWEAMVCFGAADEWFATRSIRDYDKEFQRLSQKFKNHGKSGKRKTTDQRILNPEGLTTGKFDAL